MCEFLICFGVWRAGAGALLAILAQFCHHKLQAQARKSLHQSIKRTADSSLNLIIFALKLWVLYIFGVYRARNLRDLACIWRAILDSAGATWCDI
ncbi:hypothetical protein BKN38_01850 [Helicobacter sp. CLO-3]|uniref:hypothetical protein n=1 Tax=unclassified Helicobacter TaxID=2593540 RepID=UPI000805FE81|nr:MULTISPECIES: hypothetical protein [unclassified Helicobacter]OBV28964.1 hypothetical protein BA723_01160 [Helicobacter sp. CLO-3]OHU84809.1 hypothetical protein BKN38_01850 [Helicobacter sp. CLO-3]